jgi:MFS family permease
VRAFRLARIAAEAEGLRLRERMRRTAMRAAFGIVAMGFLAGAVVFAHVAAWFWLRVAWEAQYAALMVAGADLVLAIVLALLAARSTPSRVELEALAVRRRAIDSVGSTLAFSALAMQLLRLFTNLLSRRRTRD